jgi:MoaA/NifB/PqqE/SkfB family radical SAM enzyme
MDISENGDVTLCPFMGEKIGNIFKENLSNLWFSDRADIIRRKMVKGRCPGCWLSCYAEENIRLTARHGLKANLDGLKRYAGLWLKNRSYPGKNG